LIKSLIDYGSLNIAVVLFLRERRYGLLCNSLKHYILDNFVVIIVVQLVLAFLDLKFVRRVVLAKIIPIQTLQGSMSPRHLVDVGAVFDSNAYRSSRVLFLQMGWPSHVTVEAGFHLAEETNLDSVGNSAAIGTLASQPLKGFQILRRLPNVVISCLLELCNLIILFISHAQEQGFNASKDCIFWFLH
jgi:hypothetical protein